MITLRESKKTLRESVITLRESKKTLREFCDYTPGV